MLHEQVAVLFLLVTVSWVIVRACLCVCMYTLDCVRVAMSVPRGCAVRDLAGGGG